MVVVGGYVETPDDRSSEATALRCWALVMELAGDRAYRDELAKLVHG